ncbi:hypothetical protein I350_07237 [Cryptococcus amylolentus CBS 6273]|uniref:Uncharacterized protein n=1 Tax=Cryptococcus amylolentus CBS 6273 TaxID=1296118 RepID=A0A1E3JE30_9TREE|nr:hypothetical protein I350_07237 [Cryptococcus amylolentus CBS 6273]
MAPTSQSSTGPGPPKKTRPSRFREELSESDTSSSGTDIDTPSESSDSEEKSDRGRENAKKTRARQRQSSSGPSRQSPRRRTSTRPDTDESSGDDSTLVDDSDDNGPQSSRSRSNRSKSKKTRYPPSPPLNEKLKIKKGFSREDFTKRLEQYERDNIDREPFLASCCGDCTGCWRSTWGWAGWRWMVRKAPHGLGLFMVFCGALCALTGPQLDWWAVEVHDYKFGGLGWCQGSRCQTGVFYTSVTVGSWPAITVPALLMCFGGLAIIQLLLLIFNILFLRHNLQSCCTDLEAQTKSRKSSRNRRAKSSVWFERTMTVCTLGNSVMAIILAAWASQNNAQGKIGYKLAIFLMMTPLIWFFLGMSYRSRWAYYSDKLMSSASRSQKKVAGSWDMAYRDPDEDEVVASRTKVGTDRQQVVKPARSRGRY